MRKRLGRKHLGRMRLGLPLAIFAAAVAAQSSYAQTPAQFFAGKTVKIIIGFSPAGTYGQYSQLMARHIKKHVPGNPAIIVQSVRGAGGIAALNYLANIAPQDGTVLITAPINVVQDGLLNLKAQYDPAKFQWIGRTMELVQLGVVTQKSGITTLADATKKSINAGGIGATNPTSMNWKIINKILGTKFNIISGYKGLPDATLAFTRGEVDAVMMNWETAVQRFPNEMKSGKFKPLFAYSSGPVAEVKGLTALGQIGKTDVQKAFLRVYTVGPRIGRSLAVYGSVPSERLAMWRKSFDAMLKDAEFLAEVNKRKMRFDPLPGTEVAKFVGESMQFSKETLAGVKDFYKQLTSEK